MFIQPTRILQLYVAKLLWKWLLQVLVVDFLGHLADLHLHHSDLAYVASSGVASQVQRLREAIDDHLPEVGWGWSLGPIWGVFFNSESKGILAICIAICVRRLCRFQVIIAEFSDTYEALQAGRVCEEAGVRLLCSVRSKLCFLVEAFVHVYKGPRNARDLACSTFPFASAVVLSRQVDEWEGYPWCSCRGLPYGGSSSPRDAPCTTVQPPNRQLCRDKALAWIVWEKWPVCTTWWRLGAVKRQIFCNLPDQTA